MGGAGRRGQLGKDLPSRFCRGAGPPPAGRGQQPLKEGRGSSRGQQGRDPSAAVQACGSRTARSPSLLRPLPGAGPAQGARTGSGYKTQRQVATRPKDTCTVVKKKLTGWKEVTHADTRLRWKELGFQPFPSPTQRFALAENRRFAWPPLTTQDSGQRDSALAGCD